MIPRDPEPHGRCIGVRLPESVDAEVRALAARAKVRISTVMQEAARRLVAEEAGKRTEQKLDAA
jgi:hypothetical protein